MEGRDQTQRTDLLPCRFFIPYCSVLRVTQGLFLQLQQEAQAEFEEKLKMLNMEVQEMVKNYTQAGFPREPETLKEAAPSVPERGQGPTDPWRAKTPGTEVSRPAAAASESPGAEPDVEIEESRC